MKASIDKYEFDVRPEKRVYECYQWLVEAVLKILTRERHEYNRTEWDGANHDRNNMPRGVGGPGSLAALSTVPWIPTTVGTRPNTGGAGTAPVKHMQTCSKTLAGKRCNRPDCQYDHTPLQQAPQQQAPQQRGAPSAWPNVDRAIDQHHQRQQQAP